MRIISTTFSCRVHSKSILPTIQAGLAASRLHLGVRHGSSRLPGAAASGVRLGHQRPPGRLPHATRTSSTTKLPPRRQNAAQWMHPAGGQVRQGRRQRRGKGCQGRQEMPGERGVHRMRLGLSGVLQCEAGCHRLRRQLHASVHVPIGLHATHGGAQRTLRVTGQVSPAAKVPARATAAAECAQRMSF